MQSLRFCTSLKHLCFPCITYLPLPFDPSQAFKKNKAKMEARPPWHLYQPVDPREEPSHSCVFKGKYCNGNDSPLVECSLSLSHPFFSCLLDCRGVELMAKGSREERKFTVPLFHHLLFKNRLNIKFPEKPLFNCMVGHHSELLMQFKLNYLPKLLLPGISKQGSSAPRPSNTLHEDKLRDAQKKQLSQQSETAVVVSKTNHSNKVVLAWWHDKQLKGTLHLKTKLISYVKSVTVKNLAQIHLV